jgi:transcription elongation factor GreA
LDARRVPVTREGLERLKAELNELREVRRPAVIAAVAEARSHGDLRENAAYDASRQDQAMVEKRIADLEGLVRSAIIIDEDQAASRESVGIGSTVVVDFDGAEERFTIVGAIEAKPAAGLISNESPIGKALLGTRVGQDAYVMTPGGQRRIRIKQIVR